MDPQLKKDLGLLGPVLEFNEDLILKYDPRACEGFLDLSDFPWVRQIEAQWGAIRAELDALLKYRPFVPPFQKVSSLQGTLTTDESWRTYFFRVYGWDIPQAAAQCPRTTEALRAIPGMTLAMYSILEPQKRLPAHRGPHKGVLRYHLGLKVPSTDVDACGIRIKNERRSWSEGQSLIFDDTHDHEAWNNTDEIRAVLFVDFPRPLSPWLSSANWLMSQVAKYLSPDVREARENAIRYAQQIPIGRN